VRARPFYASFAWAYDRIIAEPEPEHYDRIVQLFTSRGVGPGSGLLDAGCGTGRYALALARRGYQVTGVDASPDLLWEAQRKAAPEGLALTFERGDLLSLAAQAAFDGILCRGVLNDLLDDASRQEIFRIFARALRPTGALLLDVREWQTTAQRYKRAPHFTKQVETERGTLTFHSLTRLSPEARILRITERHQLQQGAELITADYAFAMRCWVQEELTTYFVQAGFGHILYLGAYDVQVPPGTTDRIVAITQRQPTPHMREQELMNVQPQEGIKRCEG